MKKIMFLGGSFSQLPAIKYAVEQGYYTLVCDYLENNPGQNFVDKFYCVSTTDEKAILKIAKEENIDGIVAYASDPAAPTAAYVSNKLKLPSNPYSSVKILANKSLFRNFLKENGFNAPKAKSYTDFSLAYEEIHDFKFPLIVKPTDSSGSKGVSRLNTARELKESFEFAISNSREKKVIVEEFIQMNHEFMIGGDIFVLDGEIKFSGFLNCHRNKNISPYVPVGKSYPLFLPETVIKSAEKVINRVLSLLDIQMGALNVELMLDEDNEIYIIEMGPRNGGNMIPNLLEDATGVNLIGATVEAAIGNKKFNLSMRKNNKYYAMHVLHSDKNGKLGSIEFSERLKSLLYREIIYKSPGDHVEYFDGANKAIGLIFMEFNSILEMQNFLGGINEHIVLKII